MAFNLKHQTLILSTLLGCEAWENRQVWPAAFFAFFLNTIWCRVNSLSLFFSLCSIKSHLRQLVNFPYVKMEWSIRGTFSFSFFLSFNFFNIILCWFVPELKAEMAVNDCSGGVQRFFLSVVGITIFVSTSFARKGFRRCFNFRV